MRHIALAGLAVTMSALPALATQTAVCEADDASLELSLSATFTSGLGGGMVGADGNLQLLLPGAPPQLRAPKIGRGEVSQVWAHGRELKFLIYYERSEANRDGSLELVIEARSSEAEEERYRGRYRLKVQYRESRDASESKTLTADGVVDCTNG